MEATIAGPFPRNEPTPDSRNFGFFNVISDPRTYGALLYMLVSLATGIFYFTWTITGIALSLGFAILIIGIPFALLFIGSVRVLALVEGRIVEGLLGVRMPRRLPSTTPARRNDPGAHPRRPRRYPHLVVDVLPAADAAARHHLFHDRRDRPVGIARLHRRRSSTASSPTTPAISGSTQPPGSRICCTPRRD